MPEGDGFNIDVQGAAAAIDAAGGLDSAFREEVGVVEPQTEVPAPRESTTPDPAATAQARNELGQFTSPAQATEEQTADSSFMGENFDPNSLPPELQPAYKQMQAHWTRTLQQAAPYRRIAEEFQLNDPAELRQAIQFHQDLQDPSSWQTIHAELTQLLQANGMTPMQAQAAATEAVAQQQQAQGDPLAVLAQDPELQPISSVIQDLSSQVQDLKSSLQQAQEAERQQAIELAVRGEHQRQENIIRQSRPDWKDEDVDAIYALAANPANGGNLLDAAAQYEAMQARWAEGFISQKQSPAAPAAAPVNSQEFLAEAMQTPAGEEAARVPTLDEAHTALMAHLRSIGAAD